MNPHDATEQAYRNGYDTGYKAAKAEIVRCKDCKHYKNESYPYRPNAHMMCTCWNDYLPTEPDDFCSSGERKEDVK